MAPDRQLPGRIFCVPSKPREAIPKGDPSAESALAGTSGSDQPGGRRSPSSAVLSGRRRGIGTSAVAGQSTHLRGPRNAIPSRATIEPLLADPDVSAQRRRALGRSLTMTSTTLRADPKSTEHPIGLDVHEQVGTPGAAHIGGAPSGLGLSRKVRDVDCATASSKWLLAGSPRPNEWPKGLPVSTSPGRRMGSAACPPRTMELLQSSQQRWKGRSVSGPTGDRRQRVRARAV